MTRMDSKTRHEWAFDPKTTGRRREAIVHEVRDGAHQCDKCTAAAVAIGHSGAGGAVFVLCAQDFLAKMAADRAARPSREELTARVNATLA